ncbi:metallophosphoesterase [Vibrio sp. 10N.261.49.A12]|uniref:metallophosphoesterase n=1 Tax=Vibrio sp. 10N.261.49.A12 TaxID=3229667 RepID=UPI0035515508
MALIESKYITTLFSELNQYGLRGNSALWSILPVELIANSDRYTTVGLLKWVDDYVLTLLEQARLASSEAGLVGWRANDSNDIYIESLNQGGMSGGLLDIRYWQEVMRPMLEQRCLQLEQGLQFKQQHHLESVFFIGDLHAQQDKLTTLLDSQGLPEQSDDSNTTIVFIGDLVDNSPNSATDHIATLNTVKNLVDNKQALCLLGNHEFNAVGWYLKGADGKHLRDRSKAGNQKQHAHFLAQVGEDSPLHQHWVEWFMTLPLYLNCGDIRAIHACWHEESIARLEQYLNPDRSLKSEHWEEAFNRNHELFGLIETLLKGPEAHLPQGISFADKNGIERNDIRVAWWKDEYAVDSYRELAVVPAAQKTSIPDTPVECGAMAYNTPPLFPVIVGHYTLPLTPFPQPVSESVVCVDYNAAKEENPLVGYHAYLPGWDESPNELIGSHGFAYANELNCAEVVSNGITQLLNAMLATLPAAKADNGFSQTVSEVLLTEWDPIGVYDPDEVDEDLADEYSQYEPDVNRLAQTGNLQQLAAYLLLTEQHVIGVEREDGADYCTKTAYKLVEKWSELLSQKSEGDFDSLF